MSESFCYFYVLKSSCIFQKNLHSKMELATKYKPLEIVFFSVK